MNAFGTVTVFLSCYRMHHFNASYISYRLLPPPPHCPLHLHPALNCTEIFRQLRVLLYAKSKRIKRNSAYNHSLYLDRSVLIFTSNARVQTRMMLCEVLIQCAHCCRLILVSSISPFPINNPPLLCINFYRADVPEHSA
jgi:hypothetical protein